MSDQSANPSGLIEQLRAWFHPRDRSLWLCDTGFICLKAITTPVPNPPAGRYFLYMKADGCLYIKNSAGFEYSCCCPQA